MTAARVRLSSVLIVVTRCSRDLDAMFTNSGIRYTAMIEGNMLGISEFIFND